MGSLRRARSALTLSSSSSSSSSASSRSSPRLDSPASSTTIDASFFSWSRWYGSKASPSYSSPSHGASKPSSTPHAAPLPPSGDVSRLVRAALRRSRASEEGASSESSSSEGGAEGARSECSSPATSVEELDRAEYLTLSPSTLGSGKEWGWGEDDGEEEEVETLAETEPETEASSLASSASSKASKGAQQQPLRNARSSSTLKARPPPIPTGKLVRRVASRASLSRDEAEIAPHSPSSPALSFASSSFSGWSPALSFSAFPAPPQDEPSLTAPAETETLSLSTRLRRAASTATLRSLNPFRTSLVSSSSASSPSLPPLPHIFSQQLPLSAPTSASTPTPSKRASLLLRDLLLHHDSASDPPPLPSSAVLDLLPLTHTHADELPSSDSRQSLSSIASTDSSTSGSSDGSSFGNVTTKRRAYDSTDSEGGRGNEGEDGEDDDDPFATFSTAATAAWLPRLRQRTMQQDRNAGQQQRRRDGGGEATASDSSDDPFADAESETNDHPPTSPSFFYPPFDPFALDLTSSASTPFPSFSSALLPSAAISPQRPKLRQRPSRILTKQRSFVDPRTRQLRTAPGVVVTPASPVRGSTLLSGTRGGEW